MKLMIGIVVSLTVGAGCRFFDVPVPAPPMVPGALLVLAMTLGYGGTDRLMVKRAQVSTTTHLCGGPTGLTESIRRHVLDAPCRSPMEGLPRDAAHMVKPPTSRFGA